MCLPIARCGPEASVLALKISTVVLPAWMASRTSVVVISSISTRESVAATARAHIASEIKPAVNNPPKVFIAALLISDSLTLVHGRVPPHDSFPGIQFEPGWRTSAAVGRSCKPGRPPRNNSGPESKAWLQPIGAVAYRVVVAICNRFRLPRPLQRRRAGRGWPAAHSGLVARKHNGHDHQQRDQKSEHDGDSLA